MKSIFEDEHEHGEGAMDHGAEHGKTTESQAMDHGAKPEMKAEGGEKQAQPMQHDAGAQAPPPTQEQLEASRLQLEASRKQLEATDAAKPKTASPSPQQTQSPHAEDGHEHEPKP